MKPGPMLFSISCAALILSALSVCAQTKQDENELNLHKNVTLITAAAPEDAPETARKEYDQFLPLFVEVTRASTSDEIPECALTIRVTMGTKEIGSKKVERTIARVSAFRKNSPREYIASLILYSYLTGEQVNKEEIEDFLKQRILGPAVCQQAKS